MMSPRFLRVSQKLANLGDFKACDHGRFGFLGFIHPAAHTLLSTGTKAGALF
jgi:hypothetical protein